MQNIFEQVKEVIVDQLGVEADEVKMESNIQTDFDGDSITLMEIVVEIEDTFEIEIPEDRLLAIATVGDIVGEIEKLV